jgi:acetyl-CoA acetyltransferase
MRFPDDDRRPVIVGIGEVVDRVDDPLDAREPLELMAEALRRADADAGAGWLDRLDGLALVNSVTWPVDRPAERLAARLAIAPRHLSDAPIGGEMPVHLLDEAARAIIAGERDAVAIVGAEAENALTKLRRAGLEPRWTPLPDEPPLRCTGADFLNAEAVRYGVFRPPYVYPFFEVAGAAARGIGPAWARADAARLWALASQTAAANPHAWNRVVHSEEEISTITPGNRPISYPYSRLMVANSSVNQGAAIIVTSRGAARAAGIGDERMIHIWGGGRADEPRDYALRANFHECPSQELVLDAAADLAEQGGGLDLAEIYTCFPCVPARAFETLGWSLDRSPTLAGGLTFFGGPYSNYMTHGVCALVRHLRDDAGRTGMAYGQGEFMTKHQALVLSRDPAPRGYAVSAPELAERARVAHLGAPHLRPDYTGPASLETFTVLFERDGAARQGVAIVRTPQNGRAFAAVPADDVATLEALMSAQAWPVGAPGKVTPGETLARWSFA